MRLDRMAILALVAALGVGGHATQAQAAWVDQGTTTSVVVVPDTAVPDTVTVTYTEMVPSTRVDVRYSNVPDAWSEVPMPPAGATGARGMAGAGAYGTALTSGANRVNVDSTKGLSAQGARAVSPSKASSRTRSGGGATIR